jgi:hypothetical protein
MFIIPLRIERTPAAQPFAIPATFLRAELAASKTGISMVYDEQTGAWTKSSAFATRARLRFALPREVLPCRVTSARLTIKLNAPSRTLQVHGVTEGQEQLFEQVRNPNGVYSFPLERSEQLQLDARGGLQFTLAISESDEELDSQRGFSPTAPKPARGARRASFDESTSESFTTWQIDYVRLDVRGQTL